jgi:hypothetical protein
VLVAILAKAAMYRKVVEPTGKLVLSTPPPAAPDSPENMEFYTEEEKS